MAKTETLEVPVRVTLSYRIGGFLGTTIAYALALTLAAVVLLGCVLLVKLLALAILR